MTKDDKLNSGNGAGDVGERDLSANRRVVAGLVGILMVMGTLVAYSPELYNMFCAATGYGGTPQRADKGSGEVLSRKIKVRFDGTVARELDWEFKPVKREITAHIGETVIAYFKARNLAATETIGSAVFNVTPEIAGSYFNKIECFCFTEQRLQANEEVSMGVSFYIDPAIVNDRGGRLVEEITLSYVFYAKKPAVKSAKVIR